MRGCESSWREIPGAKEKIAWRCKKTLVVFVFKGKASNLVVMLVFCVSIQTVSSTLNQEGVRNTIYELE